MDDFSVSDLEINDGRIEFIAEFTLKTLRAKPDKWMKLYGLDENKQALIDFFEKGENPFVVISLNAGGLLQMNFEWPKSLKSKGVFFIKRHPREAISKDTHGPALKQNFVYGDLSYSPVDHLAGFVSDVIGVLLSNPKNTEAWPQIVAKDVRQHSDNLKNNVYVMSGHVRGKTLLPFPPNADQIDLQEKEDRNLIHAIESVIIDWSNQIRTVLKADSSQPLLEGLNPLPYVEIEFWKAKATNLECIYEQLKSPKCIKMMTLLANAQSSYHPAFERILQDVVNALTEAQEISLYMKPIKDQIQDFEQTDFDQCPRAIQALYHTVTLLWANCDHYQEAARIIILLQEICNLMIQMARNYLEPTEIFKGELEETMHKVKGAVKILKMFRDQFHVQRAKMPSYFGEGRPTKDWKFADTLVYGRFDKFMSRVNIAAELLETAVEFTRLEKVELGGFKGRSLSQQVVQINADFAENYKALAEKSLDCLDPDEKVFMYEYTLLSKYIRELDLQLAAVICQGFDDCNGIESRFKLVELFGTILERRKNILREFNSRYPLLIQSMEEELDNAKIIYDAQVKKMNEHKEGKGDRAPLQKNMPPVAGTLKWTQELRDRITAPMKSFEYVDHPCMKTEEWERTAKKYQEICRLLDDVEIEAFKEWETNVNETCSFNLALPLILRNPDTKLISLNFDPHLVSVLREVRYLKASKEDGKLPPSAVQLFEREEMLWKFRVKLDNTVFLYNKVRQTVLEVEFPLIEGQLAQIDEVLATAETKLTWNDSNVWEYIQDISEKVGDLEKRTRTAKDNVDKIQQLMASWSKDPLMHRKEGRGETLLSLDDREDRLKKRYEDIRTIGNEIKRRLEENAQLFRADVQSQFWLAYVDYVDKIVVDGFFDTVQCSLRFLLDNAVSSETSEPLFQSILELQAPEMVFRPSMDPNSADGFFALIDSIISDVYKQASLISRLAAHNGIENYQPDMEKMKELSDMRQEIMDRVQNIMTKVGEYKNEFDTYAYLWVDDRTLCLKHFLTYGRVLTPDEVEKLGEEGLPESRPTLNQFKEQINHYEDLYVEVEKRDGIVLFDKWFKVDARPFRQALLNVCKRWSLMFKQHLLDYVTNSLVDLDKFIKVTDAGLLKPVNEGDFKALVDVMGHLMAVKDRQQATDELFEPLKQMIDLLKQYNQELPEEIYALLQELPERWGNTKKIAITVKQQVAPLQAIEVNNIRRKTAEFDVAQYTFREHFRTIDAFRYDSKSPYTTLDSYHLIVLKMEKEMAVLLDSAGLFEVQVPDYKQLKNCRKELKLMKTLWDYIGIVYSSIEDWKTTPWKKINVEQMEQDCKKFAKDIRGFDKEMKAWDCYTGVNGTVNNMLTSLKAVTDLQNPAIRDRHWQQLMQTTGVRFVMDDDTTLADLLSLNLYKYNDEVGNIVERASKEMAMEKVLRELNTTWASMEFDHIKHPRTQLTQLQSPDNLTDTLDENQVQLQNMLTSKFIAFFETEVLGWQRKLSVADQVITIWFEVQRTWSNLESIFIGSEDIRKQLPEDSKRFDGIDADFKALIAEVEQTKNVLEATGKPKLFERLEEIQKRLALCEKALAEYMETKRLAFPRFYFVSTTDLLDILSNGNAPEKVARHLSKIFDSLAALTFEKDNKGNNTKRALVMTAKDFEVVNMANGCDCNGEVEVWLNRLLDEQRATVRHYLTEAVASYEEKARDVWVFENPAQVALTGSQIAWTTEVNLAFARLEEGYENALKDYNKKQIAQLNQLIAHLLTKLERQGDRQKIMVICTIDVHARDVVAKMITAKVESSASFMWVSQLRHRWDEAQKHCMANICDAQFRYDYEYLGNTPRLVITPLTDRCYITLTQSLHLVMGGAPAGPAGTGKTETTKDLGKALGMMVYVFNCSEQMDYRSIGNIYKGLAQSGSWGCFDEFNRISVEVLSVVAVQVKTITDAIRNKKQKFNFMGEDIRLTPSVGLFITMNPGYAGRTELPENLKALFRPCAMVVPDFDLISEIMLVAEGFMDAKLLARKFITLYNLCRELMSKQDHYDWGLRAIKSVLVVAGALRRADPDRPEDQVLMRALRDFNVPKIVTDDLPIFLGLIKDLFPGLDVPRKKNPELEKDAKEAAHQQKLQPEDNFVLKVVQLQELLEVRHSVFILGNAGTGKTSVWKTLHKTWQNRKQKPIAIDLDPKAVSNDELFGVINPATREWKDGLFSTVMRDLANTPGEGHKWIVLDGDIDPMWIESLNTVMDDNKVLTLASNERIPLTPQMRLVFEINHLKTATPATVSRAGILYLNPTDLGWNPYVTSWIDKRELTTEKANLTILFDKYVPPCLLAMNFRFKKITPVAEISHVMMLCNLLECMLTPENIPPDSSKELYELYFVFCCIWAFGGCLAQDQLTDYRVEFSKWWTSEFKTIKFPVQGLVFDYFIDPDVKKFESWTKRQAKFELDTDIPLQSTLVSTIETTRVRYFLDLLVAQHRPVLLVGNAGTGKTVIIGDKLRQLSDSWAVVNVPFNYYTTSEMLQKVLEKPLEKKAGKNFGPPGNKRLIYFIDDLNMPMVDKYFTVQPHTILRQYLDYHHWYDRAKLTLKEISNVQYVASMNPTAGSFTITPRLQRHFSVFAISFPGQEALQTIYSSILSQHLQSKSFQVPVIKYVPALVNGALALHARIGQQFLPTAAKFHYIFNLRDLSNIFQGLLFSISDAAKTPQDLVRMWRHECDRVYRDKMADMADCELYDKIVKDQTKKSFEELDETIISQKPLIYCHFSQGMGDAKYLPIASMTELGRILNDALSQYNDLNAAMNLVLFDDAMSHICRISRILESPRGNALLVGVGGSGKQSLARLAAFISSLEVFQITIRKGYSIADLRTDIASLYQKTGIKNIGMMFLMTDAQVADERFLVLINDMLASGEISELFNDDELETVLSSMRVEVKGAGLDDSRESCWSYFIAKVRRLLKVVLCFSPVGSTLRVRGRKFPALTNCTQIDWFHEWPEDALISVSRRFVDDIELLDADMKDSVSQFMAFVHKSVNEMSQTYLMNDKRYNYTTPKSFLEQISLYRRLLQKKFTELQQMKQRLENGVERLRSASEQVADLKEKLKAQEVVVKEKNAEAERLIIIVAAEAEKVNKEKEIADVEKVKVAAINEEVSKKQQDCMADLAKAEPALIAAQEALNTLDKTNLTELKSFGSPPAAVTNVTAAVMVLLAPGGKVPKDRSWKQSKIMMGAVDKFLDQLRNYDKEHIHESAYKASLEYVKNPDFNADFIKGKSFAAGGLCAWVVNIIKFYDVYCEVEPKRIALEKANEELKQARDRLNALQARIAVLEESKARLQAEYEHASNEKRKCEEEADRTFKTIELANRFVSGLASENVRWAENIKRYEEEEKFIPGDVLLLTAFISYVGYFTKNYRVDLMHKYWMPFLTGLKNPIPTTPESDPLRLIVDDANIAEWQNQNLPADRVSIENASILLNCDRWPLIIDPQLQGIKWIKTRFGEDLKVIRLGQKGYLDTLERAIASGDVVFIENIGESIEPVLDSVLGRNTIKKGTAIKIGEKEVEYNPKFRLILQTKLANPHYKPEMQAQTTLINFTVTRDGLEDQLLASVVAKERPDLEKMKSDLTRKQNEDKITLKQLEDDLLKMLWSAQGNFLGNYSLVENLERTKRTSSEIEERVREGKITEVKINEARELYRPTAAQASLIYFCMNDLWQINPMYQFSLKAFRTVFEKAIDKAEAAEDLKERVTNLMDCITYSIWVYTTRGLFEKDKLIFTSQMTFQILLQLKEVSPLELDFLLRFPIQQNVTSPVDFLNNLNWGGIKALANMEEFKNLDRDIEGSAKRWKKFVESEIPEKEKFPQEWKNKTALQRLCMMRALRPDRMIYAIQNFIEEKLAPKYVQGRAMEFAKSFEESDAQTPIVFILSPGVDPLKDVESLGKKLGFATDIGNFQNISLGQGQEIVAERALDVGCKEGHWVILQNIHLVAKWLPTLDRKLEESQLGANENFRVFMSADPPAEPDAHVIPQGILESAIKITNEAPTGMMANLHKAFDNFTQETLEMCSRESEFKVILFSLCYFHATVCERRKFGPQGWNRSYPFNVGDLTISVSVLYNYLEANSKVPWDDLRYLFGEIMYGGHITDEWDRKLCRTYLEEYMNPTMLDGELYLAPGFPSPPNSDYKGYHSYIDETLPPESPYLYGLHPNAEIGFLTQRADALFRIVFEMQPRDTGAAGERGQTKEEKIRQVLDDIYQRLPDEFNMVELMAKVPAEDRTPYVVVAFQEAERMNALTGEMRRSLKELDLGLKGELTISQEMEELGNALFLDSVPPSWARRAFPSLYGLAQWYNDLLLRVKELETWTSDFQLPAAVWLGGLFNPQSFLTAIMQQMARKNEWPLDRMCLQVEVTKKQREDMGGPPREGAYIWGLNMEGARWDMQTGMIAEARLKELTPAMPVAFIKAIPVDRQDMRNMYECPVYKTKHRGPTFVWTFNLKSKEKAAKWVLAGVAILLQV